MLETILRRLVDHPRRQWIVITITCLTLLAVTWPAVDDYSAAKTHRAELTRTLESTRASVEGLSRLESKLREQLTSVATLEAHVMTAEQSQLFREQFVELVRQCGCAMVGNRLSPETREREWYKEDRALSTVKPVSTKAEKTPFVLRTRQLSVSVEGSDTQIFKLLEELSKKGHLIHTSRFQMKKRDEDQEKVGLDLDMILIELAKAPPKPAAA